MSDFPDDDPRHGTYAGRMAHNIAHTDPCDPFKEAARLYAREHRRQKVSGSRMTFPLIAPDLDLHSVGVTIVRMIRESA